MKITLWVVYKCVFVLLMIMPTPCSHMQSSYCQLALLDRHVLHVLMA